MVGFAQELAVSQSLLGKWRICPENRLNPEFVNRVDKDAKVMTNHLAQNLIHLSDWSLRPDRRSEFTLQHRECGLNVRTLVVVRPKLPLIELVKVEHFAPQFAAVLRNAASLEGNIRYASDTPNRFHIPLAQVGPISGDFGYRKPFSGLLQKWNELAAIANLRVGH